MGYYKFVLTSLGGSYRNAQIFRMQPTPSFKSSMAPQGSIQPRNGAGNPGTTLWALGISFQTKFKKQILQFRGIARLSNSSNPAHEKTISSRLQQTIGMNEQDL